MRRRSCCSVRSSRNRAGAPVLRSTTKDCPCQLKGLEDIVPTSLEHLESSGRRLYKIPQYGFLGVTSGQQTSTHASKTRRLDLPVRGCCVAYLCITVLVDVQNAAPLGAVSCLFVVSTPCMNPKLHFFAHSETCAVTESLHIQGKPEHSLLAGKDSVSVCVFEWGDCACCHPWHIVRDAWQSTAAVFYLAWRFLGMRWLSQSVGLH